MAVREASRVAHNLLPAENDAPAWRGRRGRWPAWRGRPSCGWGLKGGAHAQHPPEAPCQQVVTVVQVDVGAGPVGWTLLRGAHPPVGGQGGARQLLLGCRRRCSPRSVMRQASCCAPECATLLQKLAAMRVHLVQPGRWGGRAGGGKALPGQHRRQLLSVRRHRGAPPFSRCCRTDLWAGCLARK